MTNLDTRLKQAEHVVNNPSVDRSVARSIAFCLVYGAHTPMRLASLRDKPVNEIEQHAKDIMSKYEDAVLANIINVGEHNEKNPAK